MAATTLRRIVALAIARTDQYATAADRDADLVVTVSTRAPGQASRR
jgi:hypothetical protein